MQHALTVNGETVYWQREEWVLWALNEVLPLIDQAIEQAEKQMPFAWANLNSATEQLNSVNCGTVYRLPCEEEGRQPLYTNQPERKPMELYEDQLEAAAKQLAECMDYPWEHMPAKGRMEMRNHAAKIIEAAYGKGDA